MLPSSAYVELSRATSAAHVCAFLDEHSPNVFWIDAGTHASNGWSWVGVGIPARPEDVRSVPVGVPNDANPTGTTGTTVAIPAGPTPGAWVGWMTYESGARRAGVPSVDSDVEDTWMRVERVVAFDHANNQAWAIADDAVSWAARIEENVTPRPNHPHAASDDPSSSVEAVGRVSPGEYARQVDRLQEHIREGNAYVLCLTTCFTVPGQGEALPTYLRLREASQAPQGGMLRLGNVALLSASPESFLHVAAGRVKTRPIKGTAPRGRTPREDIKRRDRLAADPKERAENVMIADLMRNDLSRVCLPGSVRASQLLVVESYAQVHQLVSTVEGTLRTSVDMGDLLDAAFPAGSMTGAPKLSAMTILHGVEREARGIFSGCFGWVDPNGNAQLNMVIRSITMRAGVSTVGAGGGITWLSDRAAEVAEVGTKARAPLAALNARLPAGW